MKKNVVRIIALVLAFLLCAGILLLPVSAQELSYSYGSSDDYKNVIKNWGQREVTATFLSPNAVSFYEDNNITYAELSLLDGAADTASVPNSELYLALQELMADNQTVITTYAKTRYVYRFTDCENGSDTSISSFYSGDPIGPEWDSGATWNREHTWPNSKGYGDSENDIMMLRPTAKSENGSRGNKAYGESTGYYDPNNASNGTHNLHGDVARIMLYVYVRWGSTDITGKIKNHTDKTRLHEMMWGSTGVIESKEVLLAWMEEDPVDTWELGRNDSVESITGTRNVFVDYPELAFLLFDEEIPVDMATPSGEAIANAPCLHINTTEMPEIAATCTENGCTAGIYCNDCQSYISGNQVITSLGHSYTTYVTNNDATCTADGTKTAKCDRCEVTDTVADPGSRKDHSWSPWIIVDEKEVRTCGICQSTEERDIQNEDDQDPDDGKDGQPVNPFTDIQEADYYYDSVLWAVDKGITEGYGCETIFNPDGICTRGQVVTFLWRAAGKPEPASTVNPFHDVTESDYYYTAVLWAVGEGITEGYGSADIFNPDGDCTRGQVATFLHRYFHEPIPASSVNPFTDVAQDEFYYTAVLWAVGEEITNGYGSDTIFAPYDACTRAQIVTFLYRAMVNG